MSPVGDGPSPAVGSESVEGVPLIDDVAQRTTPAVTLVVAAQSALERLVRQILQPRVERGRDVEAVLVQHLGAVLLLEVFAHLFDEVGRDTRRLVRLSPRDDRPLLGGVGVRLRDVAFLRHSLQHDVAAAGRPLHVDEGALPLRRLEDAGDERSLLQRELLVRLLEIQPRRGLDAVRAVTEVHLVAVDREDFLLRVALLDLNRENRFADFPFERFLVVETELLFQVPRELLRERARTLRPAPLDDVGGGGHEDAPDVDAEVAVEFRVLGRDDRLSQQRVDLVVSHHHAALRRELADGLAAAGVDARDGARGVVVERGYLWEVAGVGEHDAAEDAEHRRDDEQRNQSGVARDFDDYVSQGKGPQLQYSMRLSVKTVQPEIYSSPLNFYTKSIISTA